MKQKRGIWDQLVWRYCVNEQDKEGNEQATAAEETVFWFRLEVSALAWLLVTVPLPGELPSVPTWIAVSVFLFARGLRSMRASRPLYMQCTIMDTGASMMGVMFSIPYCAGIGWIITLGLTFLGGLY